jgi:5-methylcytosine-specific restriction endonuclease McrA
METKICNKCGEELPATSEYFPKDKKCNGGIQGTCKVCRFAYEKTYREAHKEHTSERVKKYRKDNKEKVANQSRQYHEKARESIFKQKKQYREANKDAIAKYNKQYKQGHIEEGKQYREKNREALTEYRKQYSHANKEKVNIKTQRYKAKKRSLSFTLTILQWEEAKQYFDEKCVFCGKSLPLTQEHFIAVTKNGGYTKENIIPSCERCNKSKGVHDGLAWFKRQPFYSKKREAKIIKYLGYTKNVQQMAFI